MYKIYNHEKYYPGRPDNIHIQSFILFFQEINWVITTKKGKRKLPIFCGNGEQVIPIYYCKATSLIPREGKRA